jgi:hypothetical protein
MPDWVLHSSAGASLLLTPGLIIEIMDHNLIDRRVPKEQEYLVHFAGMTADMKAATIEQAKEIGINLAKETLSKAVKSLAEMNVDWDDLGGGQQA